MLSWISYLAASEANDAQSNRRYDRARSTAVARPRPAETSRGVLAPIVGNLQEAAADGEQGAGMGAHREEGPRDRRITARDRFVRRLVNRSNRCSCACAMSLLTSSARADGRPCDLDAQGGPSDASRPHCVYWVSR